MFRSLKLFSALPCPSLSDDQPCTIPQCLFSHTIVPPPPPPPPKPTVAAAPLLQPVVPEGDPKPATAKKRELTDADRRLRAIVDGRKAPPPRSVVVKPPAPVQTQAQIQPPKPVSKKKEDDRPVVKRRKLTDDELELDSDDSGGVMLLDAPPQKELARDVRKVLREEKKREREVSEPLGECKRVKETAGGVSMATATATATKPTSSIASAKAPQPVQKLPVGSVKRSATGEVVRKKSSTSTSTKSTTTITKPASKPASIRSEPLHPRALERPPTSHAIRQKYITKLHAELTRLHNNPKDPATQAAIITQTLDIEYDVGLKRSRIYSSVMGRKIMSYLKMKPAQFAAERAAEEKKAAEEEEAAKGKGTINKNLDNTKPALNTGITPAEEIERLAVMCHTPDQLVPYSYTITPPTPGELKVARLGLETAGGWEQCDRCSQRFQVFPGRRATDGALTTGGTCTHHSGKQRRKISTIRGSAPVFTWSCCHRVVGSDAGCTTVPCHVFKVSDPKRMGLVLPWITTPENPNAEGENRVVAFDCEMSYTTFGMELVRITATAFPSGTIVLDALVRPFGEILDLNTSYSGVSQDMLAHAPPYSTPLPYPDANTAPLLNPTAPPPATPPPQLPILASPQAARNAFLHYIAPTTVLLGHALENDLNVIRLCHARVVDTAVMYAHKNGPPSRNKLKYVVERVLAREIQVEHDDDGAEVGHDSAVDARCAAECVRARIASDVKREMAQAAKGKAKVT